MNKQDSLHKNMEIELTIDDLSSEAVGIAHWDLSSAENVNGLHSKLAVFVPEALPNEQVSCKIVKVQKNCAYARLNKINTKSNHRCQPECKYYRLCGGCSTSHMTYEYEIEYKINKVKNALKRIGNIDAKINTVHPAQHINNYRNKSIFPISDQGIGMYRTRSHDIVNLESCLLQSKKTNQLIPTINKWITDNNISVYDESSKQGILRHILVRTNINDEFLICLVVTRYGINYLDKLINKLNNYQGFLGLILNKNSKNTNVILGEAYKTIYGKDTIVDQIGDLSFELSVPSFFQINRPQAHILYDRAVNFANLRKDDIALDLFCGTGTITLHLAKHAKFVYGIEVIEDAIVNAKRNAELNNIKNVEFICADANTGANNLLSRKIHPNVICVDPPRKGLEQNTIKTIKELNPKKIVYISCKPSTLARDLKIFTEGNNQYAASKIEIVDMFPRTHHVETITLLNKVNKNI